MTWEITGGHPDAISIRDQLHPADAPNTIIWCERCQREHRQYTFTQADYDAVVKQQAKALADKIDADALGALLKAFP